MRPNLQFPADLVIYNEEILNGKLHFLCSSMPVKAILYLQKVLSIYWQVILGLVTDNNSVEI